MLLKNVEVVITCPDTFIKEDGDSKPKQIKTHDSNSVRFLHKNR